jgi:hypothetical protein
MIAVLSVYLGVGITLTAIARKYIDSPWKRAITGALAWPSFPVLIARSRIRHNRKKKVVSP